MTSPVRQKPKPSPPFRFLLTVVLVTCASVASAQQMSVETWLRSLASTQKFDLIVGVGVGSVLVTPPAEATPATIGDTLAKAGVPFGFTTSKDGSKILILQLGIDALSKSVGVAGGSGASSSGDPSLSFRESRERDGERAPADPEASSEKIVEDPNDPRLQPKPILPPQADPDDPIEAMIDRSIPPLPKQIDMSDPDEAQVDPLVKPLPPQIDYNDPDERRTPPPPATSPGASSSPQKSAPKPTGPPKPASMPGPKTGVLKG